MRYSKGNKTLFAICLLLACVAGNAQYHPQYSQYMFNGLALNPAYAGSQEVLSLAAFHRTHQWGNSMEGAPVTQTFSTDFPLRNPQVALGMLVFNDRISIFRQTGAYFAYAFRVRAGEGNLSFGLQAGFDLHREDAARISIIQKPDPLFELEVHNSFMPNVGVGTYYYASNYFVGLSLPQFLTYSPRTADSYSAKPAFANIMLYGGMTVSAARGVKIKPSALLKHANDRFHADLNCNVLLWQTLELGVSLRNKNTLVGMAQIRYQSFCIGYAYDYALRNPSALNAAHEIMLRYDLKIIVKALNPLHIM